MKCKNKGKCCKELIDGKFKFKDIILNIQDGVCDKLIDGRCSIYSKRPKLCREFHCKYCNYK